MRGIQNPAEIGTRTTLAPHDFIFWNSANVTFNTDGTIRALNGTGSITTTDRTGRQYDEREWRLGLRFGF